ncbi:NADPH:quinone reductase [Flammeovirga pectinis]|uniref:NADPH:quinone reductase n=1 Tax=Flammeovirga pectinis TaxID=2494373 RepID=A0A3Q9FR71_9BACT|nr:NADPH:quinone reductase [Flammeovirga pectinis]AZQ65205.1 NADPH:quinone reductase [Flammeovirga pectinis]
MKAAWYTEQGKSEEVFFIGERDEPQPLEGEIQIKVEYAGVNPGEISKRIARFGGEMPYPLVIPHSDGSGIVTKIGVGVDKHWLGKKVMCFGAQSYRPFGTAATYTCVPATHVFELDDSIDMQQAAQMGIPAITGHYAVYKAGDPRGKTILVSGGAGAVGQCAIQFAKRGGAKVIATVRKQEDRKIALYAGADEAICTDKEGLKKLATYKRTIDHIVEVAFSSNLELDNQLLKVGGSISTFATTDGTPKIPFWQLVFDNISIHFLGSDDFPLEAKQKAMREAANALEAGWKGLSIYKIYPLEQIAEAHNDVEFKRTKERILLKIS